MYQPIRNKNRPWRPYFFSHWDKMCKFCKGPHIEAPCQVWLNFALWFQRRRFFYVSANQKQESSMAAMFFVRSGQNVQTL